MPLIVFLGDEDFLIFNVLNAAALRDNVRQSALELTLLSRAVPSMTFDTSACPGASASAAFDGAHLALMGHSMGAWIAPLTLAFAPRFGAAILSGAGGSYIANVMDKIKPLHVRPYAEILLDYNMDQRSLEAHDPALTLLQWAEEPSDPQVYARRIVREPAPGESARHILMEQGIVDHYILPSIANSLSLSLGLDAAGPLYDADSAEEQSLTQPSLASRLPLVGRGAVTLPVAGNVAGTSALVIQHLGDAIEDGHEVVFQTDPPKRQYRCFLASLLTALTVTPALSLLLLPTANRKRHDAPLAHLLKTVYRRLLPPRIYNPELTFFFRTRQSLICGTGAGREIGRLSAV